MIWATADELRMRPARMAAAIRRDWLRIVVVVLAATALAAAAAWLLPDRYEGRAQILVETGEGAGLAAEQAAAQVDVVASADILETVARALDLAGRSEFSGDPDLVSRVLVLVGMRSDPDSVPAEEQAVRTLRGGLDVNASGDGRIITVAFRSTDAALAAAVPNAIADRYVALQQAARQQAEPQAAGELAAKIDKLRADVRALDARLAALRQGGGKAADPAIAQRRELEARLSRIEAGRAADESRAGELREAIGDAAALAANPDMQASDAAALLFERHAALRAEISDLSATLLENHPRMKALRAQLGETDAAIAAEARKVIAGLEADAKAAASQAGKVRAELDAIGAAVDDAADRDTELRSLEAQSAAQHRLLDAETARQRDAAAGTSRFYLPADARAFSRAVVPSAPVSPNRLLLVGAAFALSLFVMLAASVLRRRDAAAAAAEPAELPAVDEVEMPAVATADPEPEPTPALAATAWTRSDAVRAARDAEAAPLPAEPIPATLVIRRAPHVAPEAAPARVRRTIGEIDVAMAAERLIAGGATRAIFVSPEGDEGAAASVLVARDVADAGLRVVLLDLTASGAASQPMLEGTVYTGITNLLVSEAQFGDIIHNDLYSASHVIPVGTADPVRAMRAAERLPIILDSLTTAYDLVVVECGATDAEDIRRLVVDDTSIMLAAIEPSDEIAEAALELARKGLGRPIIVSPGKALPPRRPDRSAA